MEKKLKIQRVSSGILGQVIEHRTPCGLFLTKEGRKWVAVDGRMDRGIFPEASGRPLAAGEI